MEIESRLRIVIAEKGIRQKDLAEQAGISAAQLSALVNKKSLPTLPVAYRISEVLGVPVEDIWVKVHK